MATAVTPKTPVRIWSRIRSRNNMNFGLLSASFGRIKLYYTAIQLFCLGLLSKNEQHVRRLVLDSGFQFLGFDAQNGQSGTRTPSPSMPARNFFHSPAVSSWSQFSSALSKAMRTK